MSKKTNDRVKKLERCARCGHKPRIHSDVTYFFVRCHGAPAPLVYCWEGPQCATRKEARKEWNHMMRAMKKAKKKRKRESDP